MEIDVKLTILYDGGCPLCLGEVNFLQRRDLGKKLKFVDVNEVTYSAEQFQNITYRQAMERIHAIRRDGTVITNVAVFREAYQLINLGWIYRPTTWPLLGSFIDWLYNIWAVNRLRMTRRPSLDQLCNNKCKNNQIKDHRTKPPTQSQS